MRYMCRFLTGVSVLSALLGSSAAFGAEVAPPFRLDRIRMYDVGVAYFERTGRLEEAVETELKLPAGHLDDALKTLVVLSPDGKAKVSGVEFGSRVSRPMARMLAGLRNESENEHENEGERGLDWYELLSSLRGSDVEAVTKAGKFVGRLLDVRSPSATDLTSCAAQAKEQHEDDEAKRLNAVVRCVADRQGSLAIMTARGQMRTFPAADVESVRATDPAVQGRLSSALNVLLDSSAQTRHGLRIVGNGPTPVTLGYVTEAPIWRATYRLVLQGEQAALQGWALIHNDTDEDWQELAIEIANGEPDSFLFPLAAPRYRHRRIETPDEQAHTVPQLLGNTVDSFWGDELGESFGVGGLGLTGTGEGGGGRGQGFGYGHAGVLGSAAAAQPSSLLRVGNLAQTAAATGIEAGALFTYQLPGRFDLRAHASAMIPFTTVLLPARRITWFSAPGTTGESAIFITNQSAQTLPSGPLGVFADDGFAGETQINRLKPKQSQIVRFGNDLDVELEQAERTASEQATVFEFGGGQLVEHFIKRSSITYAIVNRSAAARTIHVLLDVVENVRSVADIPLETDPETGRPLAVFQIEARRASKPRLVVEEGLRRQHAPEQLTANKLREWSRSSALASAQAKILKEAGDLFAAVATTKGTLRATETTKRQLETELSHLRKDLTALGTRPGAAAETLSRRLLETETQARTLRRRASRLAVEISRAQTAATAKLSELKR